MKNGTVVWSAGWVQVWHDGEKHQFQFAHMPGREIGNHALLLAESRPVIKDPSDERYPFDSRRESYVLCVTPGFQPFVTWRRTVFIEQTATGALRCSEYCYSGDYYHQLDTALNGYLERSK